MSWVIAFRENFCTDIKSVEVAALNVVHQFMVGKTEENYEKQVGVAGNFTESRDTFHSVILALMYCGLDRFYRGALKSLARLGRKQTPKHVRDVRDFNNTETRAVIKFPPPPGQDNPLKEIHAILTETLACFLPGRA